MRGGGADAASRTQIPDHSSASTRAFQDLSQNRQRIYYRLSGCCIQPSNDLVNTNYFSKTAHGSDVCVAIKQSGLSVASRRQSLALGT